MEFFHTNTTTETYTGRYESMTSHHVVRKNIPFTIGSSKWEVTLVSAVVVISLYLVVVNAIYCAKKRGEKLQATNVTVLTATCVVLVQSALLYVRMQVGSSRNYNMCLADTVVQKLLSTFGRCLLYMVFWMRYYNFSKNNPFARISPRLHAWLSHTLRVVIFMLAAMYIAGYSLYWFLTKETACSSSIEIEDNLVIVRKLLIPMFSVITAFQLFLLLPVLVPLAKRCVSAPRYDSNPSTQSRLKWLVVRLSLAAGMIIATDLVMIVLAALVPRVVAAQPVLLPLLHCLTTTVHIASFMFSFFNHRVRICPFQLICKFRSGRSSPRLTSASEPVPIATSFEDRVPHRLTKII